MASSDGYNLFAGVIHSIKTYDGDDPLLPWLQYSSPRPLLRLFPRVFWPWFGALMPPSLSVWTDRGIKKLKSCLPPPVVKEKLPRFLQRCVSSFRGDGRYRNDPRYIRVLIQLVKMEPFGWCFVVCVSYFVDSLMNAGIFASDSLFLFQFYMKVEPFVGKSRSLWTC